MNLIEERQKLLNRRDELLNHFRHLTKLTEFIGADLANANAEVAIANERVRVQEEEEK